MDYNKTMAWIILVLYYNKLLCQAHCNLTVMSQACGVPLADDQHDASSFGVFSLTP